MHIGVDYILFMNCIGCIVLLCERIDMMGNGFRVVSYISLMKTPYFFILGVP